MALRFMDSWDHYATADLLKKWTLNSSATISAGAGRRGTSAMAITTSTYLEKTLESHATWIVGFAFRCSGYPAAARNLCGLLDAGTMQAQLMLNAGGTLAVTRAGTALTGGTSTATLALNTTYFLEFKVTIANSIAADSCQVRVDGTVALTVAAGADTQATPNAFANQVRLGAAGSTAGATWHYDDLYVCDGTGSVHNDYLGDCRIDCLFPSSDGSVQQWTPSTPGTHYTLVDEAAPNTTDYVVSSTVGQRDTYEMGDLTAATGTLYGVQLNLAGLKVGAGVGQGAPLLLSGATAVLGTAATLSTSQQYLLMLQATDPATGAPWTEAGVNTVQGGAEVATGTVVPLQLSQVALEVLRVNGTEGPLPSPVTTHQPVVCIVS